MEAHLSVIHHGHSIQPELHRKDSLRPHAIGDGGGKGFLGSVVQWRQAMMKLETYWHNFLFGVCCIVSLLFGMLISGAADVIAEQAQVKQAKNDGLQMIKVLGEIPVTKDEL